MNEHCVPSNRETLSWFKDNLKNGKASEEMFKTEALSFFNLSPEMGAKVKRSFTREVKHFAPKPTEEVVKGFLERKRRLADSLLFFSHSRRASLEKEDIFLAKALGNYCLISLPHEDL